MGLASRDRSVAVNVLATVLMLTACSNEASDLYCKPSECASERVDAGGDPVSQEPPWLAALPDEGARAECTACAKEKCSLARSNCLQDDACTAQLACSGECEDPGCLQDCQGRFGVEGRWSPWWWDLYDCAYRSCATECNAGENWACVGRYDWPTVDPEQGSTRQRLELRVWALGYHPGATVRVCAEVEGCEGYPPIDEDVLDAANRAELVVPVWEQGFRGFFELEEPGPREFRVHYLPLARSIALELDFPPPDSASLQVGRLPTEEEIWILVRIQDCTGRPGSGVRVELPTQPEVLVAHGTSAGALALSAQETSVGAALALDVAEPALAGEGVSIRAVLADSGEPIAERVLDVRARWMSVLHLAPRSRTGD